MNTVSPITFIDKLVKKNERGQPFRLIDHQREVLTLAWGFTQEAPNELLILANDLEQTLARVFKTMGSVR